MPLLEKGATLALKDSAGANPQFLNLGAGWDSGGKNVDIDIMLAPVSGEVLYYGRKEIPGATLDKDDRTGDSSAEGCDENIRIDASKLAHNEYYFLANVYAGAAGFQEISNVFAQGNVAPSANFADAPGAEIFKQLIAGTSDSAKVLVIGKIVKEGGGVKFTAINEYKPGKTADQVITELGSRS